MTRTPTPDLCPPFVISAVLGARPGVGRAASAAAAPAVLPGRVDQWYAYGDVYGTCLDAGNGATDQDLRLVTCTADPRTTASDQLPWAQAWLFGTKDANGRSQVSTYVGTGKTPALNPQTGVTYATAQQTAGQRICLDGVFATDVPLRPVACSAAVSQKLRIYGQERRSDGTVDVALSYTVVDTTGRCLSRADSTLAVAGGTGYWSSVRWSACTGGAGQKWNAPLVFDPPGQRGFREDP